MYNFEIISPKGIKSLSLRKSIWSGLAITHFQNNNAERHNILLCGVAILQKNLNK
jgi:hypothetical protein